MDEETSSHDDMNFLEVPNVQSLAAELDDSCEISDRYIRPEIKSEPATNNGGDVELAIPVINMSKLLDPEFSEGESARLHLACQDWGFFQLVNHHISSHLIERMRSDVQEFFALPLEIKKKFSHVPGSVEGYGQMFVLSTDQKLDWGDMLFLRTRPSMGRSMHLWPTQPLTFRDTLDRYSEEVYMLANSLVVWIAKNLGVDSEIFCDMLKNGIQSVRMNYYPPCPQSDQVLGISPHSDNTLLTILLQVNEVQGLQVKNNGRWISINPLPDAFVINIGDSLEIISNGIYKSIEHRSSVDREKERLSIPAFFSPNKDCSIGPHPDILRGNKANYKIAKHGDLQKLFFSAKLYGKSIADHMKLND